MGSIPTGQRQIHVRAFRYSPATRSELFTTRDSLRLDIYMERVAHLLSELVVHGRSLRVPRGFEGIYARGTRGWGTLITREQIDSLNPLDLKTMLREVPGVYTNDRGVSFSRCYGSLGFGSETAELWIDGERVTKFVDPTNRTDPSHFNEFLTSVLPTEVQAMEVYTSSGRIPAEFAAGGSPCAIIAVWRKRGP